MIRVCWLLVLVTLCGCGGRGGTPAAGGGKPTVAVVNYPLKYFAERIGGEQIQIYFPVPAGEDPDFWKPEEGVVEVYQQADLILLNGFGYGRWVAQATLPPGKCVDTAAALKGRAIEIKDAVTHSHGPAGEHTHAGTATLSWLDLQQAILQAEAVRDALRKLLPAHAATFDTQFAALKSDLEQLDREMLQATRPLAAEPVIASHPVFQYWARRYGVAKLQSVHLEAGEAPKPEELKNLRALVATHPAKWVIWEDTPLPETVKALEGMGLRSVELLTLGNTPEGGDFLAAMKRNIDRLREAFGPPAR